MSATIRRKMFTTDEYHRMVKAGILRQRDHLELIEGEIVHKAPIGSRHAACVNRLNQSFVGNFAGKAVVHVQNPVCIGDHSEPEPDITLLKPRPDFYAHPVPEDVLLIVEVADSSVDYDQQTKMPLYAKSGVREAWIVNLNEACVEVYTNPSDQGYDTLRKFRKGMTITPGCFSEVEVPVDEIIGEWEYPFSA